MLFSIVINNYNYENYIKEAIESVLNQSYTNFEIIIVDDCSNDNSREIIKEYENKDKRIKALYLNKNKGQANALNEGVKSCIGDVICFLDSDDWFRKDKLETLKIYFEKGFSYIHHNHLTYKEGFIIKDNLKRFDYVGNSAFLVYYLSLYVGNICSTLAISKELKNLIFPLIDEKKWRIQADDLIVFQAALAIKSMHLSEPLTCYRVHNNNGYFGKKMDASQKYELLKKRNILKEKACKRLSISEIFFKNTYNLLAEVYTYEFIDLNLVSLYLKIIWFEMNIPLLNRLKTTSSLIKIWLRRK